MVVNTSISPSYFWYEMTREELEAVYDSMNKSSREKWEIMRIQTFHSILPHIDKKAIKNFTPQKLIPFTWDEGNELLQQVVKERKQLTTDERRAAFERMSKAKSTGVVADDSKITRKV